MTTPDPSTAGAPTPSPYDTYTSPLASRNASQRMLRLWSSRHKFNTWRRIWLAVAEAQHELGLPVTREQVDELRAVVERKNPDGTVGITDDEIRLAEKYERDLRHDVMAHVHALGDSCPKAKGIIHLGMTSQDVNDNAELSQIGAAARLKERIDEYEAFAEQLLVHVDAISIEEFGESATVLVGPRENGERHLGADGRQFAQSIRGHVSPWRLVSLGRIDADESDFDYVVVLVEHLKRVAIDNSLYGKAYIVAIERNKNDFQIYRVIKIRK